MINRLKIIFNLLLGKDIVIYNVWTRKILMVIGSDEEILTKRWDYSFIGREDACIYGNEETGEIFLRNEDTL